MSNRIGDYITLLGGKQYWPCDPRPEEMSIEAIANGLASENRWGGQLRRPYNVAHHSVLVSGRAAILASLRRPTDTPYIELCARAGLVHDAPEGLGLRDMPRPIKKNEHMDFYRYLHKINHIAVCQRFGLPPDFPPEVKKADDDVLAAEQRDFYPDHPPSQQHVTPGSIPWPEATIVPWDFERARAEFLDAFELLWPSGAR